MSANRAHWLVFVLCLSLIATVGAQKGGKPKPVDRPGTAVFRCNGPTATTHLPPGTRCGPWSVPDAITGDGPVYSATLRFDGEFDLYTQSTAGRVVFLNFESWYTPASGRKNFDFADVPSIGLNTNVIIPGTETVAGNGILSIPVGQTWPTRIKGNWTDPYGVLYTIRFNPTDYPGSTHAHVTRNAENSWTVFATDIDVARLVSPGVHNQGPRDEGSYRMPFAITFTVP
jgi:hypothetical protein